ncbi:MAG: ABC transporter ATP-binding protein [Enterococcus sp.]|nr:ABC transporter ATP-binding protein [Enterococcus sp.]
MHFVEFKDVSKIYNEGENEVRAVDNVSFTIEEGELVVIVGSSGAGKTTILNLLGGMDSPTKGNIFIKGKDISKFKQKELTKYRRHKIGFIFQFYNLCQNLTVEENVELATQICKNPLPPDKALNSVGLLQRKNNFPSQISGGEQQRVAVARALAKNPEILLCDEPTGALDYKTGLTVLELLQDTSTIRKKTVVLITHNNSFCQIADRVIEMKYGKVFKNYKNENPLSADNIEW